VYARATQLTDSRELRSTPMEYMAVATMVVSSKERKSPTQTLERWYERWSSSFYRDEDRTLTWL
jgi:hypothetical protein